MGRLIDADKLKQHYSWWGGLIGDDYVSELVEQKKVFDTIVDVQPTVDAEPMRHGHWIFNPKDAIEIMFTLPKCSECGAESSDGGNYCPNCGAKMDEVEKDADK